MLDLVATAMKRPHPMNKLLQVARRRVTRWFRPPSAARAPHPTMASPSNLPKMENRYDEHP